MCVVFNFSKMYIIMYIIMSKKNKNKKTLNIFIAGINLFIQPFSPKVKI